MMKFEWRWKVEDDDFSHLPNLILNSPGYADKEN